MNFLKESYLLQEFTPWAKGSWKEGTRRPGVLAVKIGNNLFNLNSAFNINSKSASEIARDVYFLEKSFPPSPFKIIFPRKLFMFLGCYLLNKKYQKEWKKLLWMSNFSFFPPGASKIRGGGVDFEKYTPLVNAKICKICNVIILNGLLIDK